MAPVAETIRAKAAVAARDTERGQAVIESLIVTIGLIIVTAGFLFWFYSAMAVQWCDFWIYRSTICLAQGRNTYGCRRELEDKIALFVPRPYFEIEELWKTPRQASAAVRLNFENDFYIFHRELRAEIALPLTAR